MDRPMSDKDRPRHDQDIEAIVTKNSARLIPIPHSRDRCVLNLAILIGGKYGIFK